MSLFCPKMSDGAKNQTVTIFYLSLTGIFKLIIGFSLSQNYRSIFMILKKGNRQLLRSALAG